MLFEFFRWLSVDYSIFNVFNYLSLRAVLSVITALSISFYLVVGTLKKLGEYSFGQYVRANGPTTHLEKMGTPTMGRFDFNINFNINITLVGFIKQIHMGNGFCYNRVWFYWPYR